ncbi:MAG: single-stranded DNA-binding protein [Actinomyces sp.]|uniref:single-stranded DNA-binding protein n=1 Tax=Actinomyces sp. TaxID=29317 RepID=UPI0026DA7473|nr:single-stranded DNA-binding protein [Actinomyces sp.]MDO4243402.1 single-stranded DNA-binding protein [Actinomyces sp.]
MSRQLDLVVQGVLGTHPSVVRTAAGKPFCHFRLATTPSFRTREGWREGETMWFTAKAWGALAENLGHSLHKGDPVVLVGRLSQEAWFNEAGEHLDNVLTVSCGGHDLTWGESRFMRVSRAEEEADAAPAAGSDGTEAGPQAAHASSAERVEDRPEPLPETHWQVATPGGAGGDQDAAVGRPPAQGGPASGAGLDYVLVEG